MAGSLPYEFIGAPQGESLVLAGPPRRLTGRVELKSRSDSTVIVREVGLSDARGLLAKGPLVQAIRPLVLRPGQQRRMSMALALDPATPPGEYRAELELGGQVRPVVLLVSEIVDPGLQPSSLVIFNRPGEVQRRRVAVSNEGNVAFTPGEFGAVDLEDDLVAARAMRLRLRPWADLDIPALERSAVALVPVASAGAFREAGLEVRLAGRPVELLPGATGVIDLELTLQTELPAGSRFRGQIPVLTRNIDVVVVASGAPAADRSRAAPPLRVSKATRKQRTPKKAARRPGGKR